MARGLFSGGLLGLVVGGASLSVASVMTEQPAGNTPPASVQVIAPSSGEAAAVESSVEVTAQSPQISVVVESTGTPRVAMPQLEVTQPIGDTSSADVPAVAVVHDALEAPVVGLKAPELVAETETPVFPNPQSIAPQVPVIETDLALSTQSAPPPEPIVEAVAAPVPTVDIPVPQPRIDAVVVPIPTVTIPVPVPRVADVAVEAEVVDELQVVESDVDAPVVPKVTTLAPSADQSSSLPKGNSAVKVNRIITATPAVPEAAEPVLIDDDLPAIKRYAAAFENPENKPLMSVIVLDDGRMDGAAMALKTLNFPITVVLDLSVPDLDIKLQEYRDAGIEVGVRSALPVGAGPSDVEVAFEAMFGALPDTVLLFDAGDGGLQNDRAVIEQAMSGLASSGRGLVSLSSGLSGVMRAAEKAGVPAGMIYRDLDSEDQDAAVIRRFMDQAAFRARQESGVILLARVRPNTLSALQLWGTANSDGQVALAPVSALLSR